MFHKLINNKPRLRVAWWQRALCLLQIPNISFRPNNNLDFRLGTSTGFHTNEINLVFIHGWVVITEIKAKLSPSSNWTCQLGLFSVRKEKSNCVSIQFSNVQCTLLKKMGQCKVLIMSNQTFVKLCLVELSVSCGCDVTNNFEKNSFFFKTQKMKVKCDDTLIN